MSGSEGDGFTPATGDDVAEDNPAMVRGELRALQREVRSGFELITQKVLTRLDRIDERMDVLVDRVGDLEARQSRTEERLAALEKRRKPGRK